MTLALLLLSVAVAPAAAHGVPGGGHSSWQPARTRAFIVSLTEYQGGKKAPWATADRLDGALVERLRARGVPPGQIRFLTEGQATSAKVRAQLDAFLSASRPGELLLFYFSSHGGYDAKTGAHTYATYDGHLPFEWAFDAIERGFKGSHVLMLADCCYSGGIVDLVAGRPLRHAYAALSSTSAHNVGFSGWRFFDCVLRALAGAPVVDVNGDGQVDLDELARFAARHMAFVAEGKPMFATRNGFDPKLKLANAAGRRSHPRVGEYVEAWRKGAWHKAEIEDVRPGQLRVHHTDKGTTVREWVPAKSVRPFKFARFPKGARVEAQRAKADGWFPATVLGAAESLHLCRFDGLSSAYDEWAGPSRIRARR